MLFLGQPPQERQPQSKSLDRVPNADGINTHLWVTIGRPEGRAGRRIAPQLIEAIGLPDVAFDRFMRVQ